MIEIFGGHSNDKKQILFALSVLLCLIVIICVGRCGSSFMISEMILESITRIEVRGYQNGELEPWELD